MADKYKVRYFIIALLAVSIVLSFLLLKPFLTPILASIFFAYAFYPVHKWLNSKIKRANISAFIVTLLIILLIAIPLTFVLIQLYKEVDVGYGLFSDYIINQDFFYGECEGSAFCPLYLEVHEIVDSPSSKRYIEEGFSVIKTTLADDIKKFLLSIPKRLLDIFVTFFMTFFLLRDGKRIVESTEKLIPLKKHQSRKIFTRLHNVTKSIVDGVFLIAIIAGIFAGIVFAICGVQSPIFWGLVVAIVAVIPMVGPAVVWVPMAILKLAEGSLWQAAGIAIGGVVLFVVETVVKPKIIGDKSNLHPILTILGLIGGVSLLGVMGIIFGPLILVLLFTFFKMYSESRD